jgi:phosphatidylserine decarboxylase
VIKPETQFPIVSDGFRFIGIGLALTVLAHALVGMGGWVVFVGLLTLFCTWFFRDPHRVVPEGEGFLVSPADGVVVEIASIQDHRHMKGPAIQLSIFLNVFNVHVNRMPTEGQVEGIFYNPGRFFAANVPKSSLENEQNALVLKATGGQKLVVVQIAGLIARRIVCWVREGTAARCGERFGLIRFGSRVDLILPPETEIRVSKGDRVWGGETILGTLK